MLHIKEVSWRKQKMEMKMTKIDANDCDKPAIYIYM